MFVIENDGACETVWQIVVVVSTL